MGEVAVIYGNQVLRMVEQLLERTGALDRLRPDDTVMIKPNLVASRQNWIGSVPVPLPRFSRYLAGWFKGTGLPSQVHEEVSSIPWVSRRDGL